MGKQAARLGDTVMTCNDPTDMPTGKIVSGSPTVLINNMPAARQTDQVVATDIHIIMIPTPGGPVPTPLPHPFVGKIMRDCSTSVLINNLPAATQNSIAQNIPPHIPQGGPFQKPPMNEGKILMGSLNVMIGNGGGGGGGGGSSSAAKEAEAKEGSGEEKEGHYIVAKFVDKGGKPIAGVGYKLKDPDGKESTGVIGETVKKGGISSGDCELSLRQFTKAKWGKDKAKDGEEVKLEVEGVGFEDGTDAKIEVWEKNTGGPSRIIQVIDDLKINGGKIESEWTYKPLDDEDVDEDSDSEAKSSKFTRPTYYFVAKVGDLQVRSGILDYKESVEIELKDSEGKPAKDEKYLLYASDGSVKKGKLDGEGKKKIEDLPPGKVRVEFPDRKKTLSSKGKKTK